MAQLENEHNFSYEVDRVVQRRHESDAVDGADALVPFDWKDGRAEQVRSSTSIKNTDRPYQHI